MNNKGFLLIDSLICVIVASLLSTLVLGSYQTISTQENVYKEYLKRSNEEYENIYRGLKDCIRCQTKDFPTPEQ